MDPIIIALVIDNQYSQHAGVLITSIIQNASDDDKFVFYIVNNGLAAENQRRLTRLLPKNQGDIYFKKIPQGKLQKTPQSCYPEIVYYRIMLPSVLPDLKKVLYLDSDIVVLKTLRDIWDVDLGDHSIAAIDCITEVLPNKWIVEKKAKLELPKSYKYFNSGVLLMNLDKMRSDDAENNVVDWIENNGDKIEFPDQDALNSIFFNDRLSLPFTYNAQVPIFASENRERIKGMDLADPAIIHYITDEKPWMFTSIVPYKAKYYEYLKKTPWKNFRPPDKTLKGMFELAKKKGHQCAHQIKETKKSIEKMVKRNIKKRIKKW